MIKIAVKEILKICENRIGIRCPRGRATRAHDAGADLTNCRPYVEKITSEKCPYIKILSQYHAIIFSFK